jgi:hypothetical protein
MNDKTYNGWTNYATWRVNLEMVDGLDPRDFCPDCEDIMELRDTIKQICEENILYSSQKGFARDYALTFLDDVNWQEIAKHMAETYELFKTEVKA